MADDSLNTSIASTIPSYAGVVFQVTDADGVLQEYSTRAFNLIPLNPVEERQLRGVTRMEAAKFLALMEEHHISATLRREMGADISGACGQLRRRYLLKEGAAMSLEPILDEGGDGA